METEWKQGVGSIRTQSPASVLIGMGPFLLADNFRCYRYSRCHFGIAIFPLIESQGETIHVDVTAPRPERS